MGDDQHYKQGRNDDLCPGIKPVESGISASQKVQTLEVEYCTVYGSHGFLSVLMVMAAMFRLSVLMGVWGNGNFVSMCRLRVFGMRPGVVVHMRVRV